MSKLLKWCSLLRINIFQGIINTLNVESGQSKENYRPIVGTMGLPKVGNNYGSRGVVVPSILFNSLSNGLKGSVVLGRAPGLHKCNYSNTAGDASTVKSDAIRKLL